jgi:small-conductance mechanosensitive channel
MHPATLLAQGVPEAPDLSGAIDSSGVTLQEWGIAAAILVGGVLVATLLRRLIVLLLRRSTFRESVADRLIGRVVYVVTVLVALIYALGVLGVRVAPLLGALGIGGIAVALALQPTIQNLFSGAVLHAQRPIRLGDEVITADVQGRVVDITSRAVVILTNSGETVFIPNSVVLDREIVNLVRHGMRRSIVTVGVAYDSDLGHAREVLHDAVTGVPGVLADPAPQVFAGEFAESSVQFDVLVWHEPHEADRRAVRDAVIESVHVALRSAGITIPFPQRTIWRGDDEVEQSGA